MEYAGKKESGNILEAISLGLGLGLPSQCTFALEITSMT
jgi:hypothetical protein